MSSPSKRGTGKNSKIHLEFGEVKCMRLLHHTWHKKYLPGAYLIQRDEVKKLGI